uniref:NADH dehydrogenase subunit 4L n=1 Tax=Pelusios castaneus TaxID=367368 RepID=A0A8C8RX12_9SAUR
MSALIPLTHFTCLTAFIISLVGFAFHRKHLIATLLCLEILTLSACDTSTGLSLMVASSRTHGLDSLKTLNLLKC